MRGFEAKPLSDDHKHRQKILCRYLMKRVVRLNDLILKQIFKNESLMFQCSIEMNVWKAAMSQTRQLIFFNGNYV